MQGGDARWRRLTLQRNTRWTSGQKMALPMNKEPVMVWDSDAHTWVPGGEWQFDAKGALKALDQMATILGMKRPETGDKKPGETVEQYLARTGGNNREF